MAGPNSPRADRGTGQKKRIGPTAARAAPQRASRREESLLLSHPMPLAISGSSRHAAAPGPFTVLDHPPARTPGSSLLNRSCPGRADPRCLIKASAWRDSRCDRRQPLPSTCGARSARFGSASWGSTGDGSDVAHWPWRAKTFGRARGGQGYFARASGHALCVVAGSTGRSAQARVWITAGNKPQASTGRVPACGRAAHRGRRTPRNGHCSSGLLTLPRTVFRRCGSSEHEVPLPGPEVADQVDHLKGRWIAPMDV